MINMGRQSSISSRMADPLDDLTLSLASSDFEVSKSVANDPDKGHPRMDLYKNRGKCDSSQDKRRRLLLEHQKKRRTEALDIARALVTGEDMDEDTEDEEESMDTTDVKTIVQRYSIKKSYRKQLMLSEWMVQIPIDLSTHWYVVPVPQGKRTLVVAGRGQTRRFSRHGHDIGRFRSVLSQNKLDREMVLDTIFVPASGTFYVLDVMVFKGQHLYGCDTEFRFGWAKTQLLEIPGISERNYQNYYAFKPLKYVQADPDSIRTLLSDPIDFGFDEAPLDGLLFYHRQLDYMPGHTPLVSWLKGYMVPEMLGIDVSESLLAQRPRDYAGMSLEIENFEKRYFKRKEKITKSIKSDDTIK